MAIQDNRTLLDAAETFTNFVNDTGSALGSGNVNSDTAIRGSNSIAERVTSGTFGILYDAGSAQDWSDNTFYIWWNVSTAGLLDTFENGGVRMRFCGATISDYFEVHLAGSNTYSGGWTMSAVSIERARALAVSSPTNNNAGTGGTPPATNAIRYVGIFFDMAGMVSGNVDNCFVDSLWRLPANTPGIIVRGDANTADYTWADIVDAADVGDTTKAWGTAFNRDGVIFVNTPIQFGAGASPIPSPNEPTDFTDTNAVVFFEDQIVDEGFYELTIEQGGSPSSTNVSLTGGVIGAAGVPTASVASNDQTRFSISVPNPVDSFVLDGVTMLHGGTFDFANTGVNVDDCTLSDIARIVTSDLGGSVSSYSGNSHTNQYTLGGGGTALLETNNLDEIIDCVFTQPDVGLERGHAIMITGTISPEDHSQISSGNLFVGYSDISPITTAGNPNVGTGSDFAAVFNNRGAGASPALTIAVTAGGSSPSIRNSASPGDTTIVENNVQVTVRPLQPNTEVTVCLAGTETLVAEVENTGSPAEFVFTVGSGVAVDIIIHHEQYEHIRLTNLSFTTDSVLPVTQRFDRNYNNPVN